MSARSASRRVRTSRYKRVCQHCKEEVTTAQAYLNFFYNLLCRKCFEVNASPEQ